LAEETKRHSAANSYKWPKNQPTNNLSKYNSIRQNEPLSAGCF